MFLIGFDLPGLTQNRTQMLNLSVVHCQCRQGGGRATWAGVSRHFNPLSRGFGSVSAPVPFPKLNSFHGRRLHDRWPRQGFSKGVGSWISASGFGIQGSVEVETTKSHGTEVSADVWSACARVRCLRFPVAARLHDGPFPVAH